MSIRKYSPELRLRIVKEAIESGNASEVARKYEVNNSLVHRWLRNYKAEMTAKGEIQANPKRVRRLDSELNSLGRQALTEVERLHRIIAEQALEISILKDIRTAFEKKGH